MKNLHKNIKNIFLEDLNSLRKDMCKMANVDFNDEAIEKLARIICGDDFYDKFCEDKTRTQCPVYRTTEQLDKFFDGILETKLESGQTRMAFTINCLTELNDSKNMDVVLKKLTNPKRYRNEKIIMFILNEVNEVIKWDGIGIKLENSEPIIVELDELITVDLSNEEVNDFKILDFKELMDDDFLSEIMNKRWLEIKQNYESESYLSTIVLLGSILEGLLYYYVSSNYKTVKSVPSAPKDKSGEILNLDYWKLNDMITVAHECHWLDDDIKTFNEGLRDYRNLIHPKVQKDKLIWPDKDTCDICIKVVIAAFNDLKEKDYLRK